MAGREDLPYVNARIRARKSRLLGGGFLRELAGAASLEHVVKQLGATAYGLPISRALAFDADVAAAADRAVTGELAADASGVRRFGAGGDLSPFRILFARWDVWNLKVVLRGLHGRRNPEEIVAATLPVGWVRQSVWRELAASAGVISGLEKAITMGIPEAAALHGAPLRAHEGGPDLSAAEAAVDRWFYGESFASFGRSGWGGSLWEPVERSLRWEVEARNFAAIVEGFGRDSPPGPEMLVAGGQWADRGLLARARALRDPLPLFAELAGRHYPGADGTRAAEDLRLRRIPAALEAVERAAWRRQMGLLRGPPLSTELLAGYLWARAAEARDLRRVIWGLRFGMPRDLIAEGFLTA